MPEEFEELTDKQLKWGYWFFNHRDKFKHWLEWAVGAVALVTLLYSAWNLVDWLTSRKAEEQALQMLVGSGGEAQLILQRNAPQEFEVGTATAIPLGGGRYDLVAQVKNPNFKWAVMSVDYTFTTQAGEAGGGTIFFLPLEEKIVLATGVALAEPPLSVNVTLRNFNWQRVRDLSKLQLPEFSVQNQQLEVLPAAPGELSSTRLAFDLANDSPVSYWEVGVRVLLTAGETPQAVGYQVVQNVMSGGVNHVEFFWPRQAIRADSVLVKPEVNVLDSRVIKPLH